MSAATPATATPLEEPQVAGWEGLPRPATCFLPGWRRHTVGAMTCCQPAPRLSARGGAVLVLDRRAGLGSASLDVMPYSDLIIRGQGTRAKLKRLVKLDVLTEAETGSFTRKQ
ncbi:hypothetical protein RVR_8857 [Actinacidiphila reveromycinica]|uniref:Uncharacterized protein n=1 Tax=Actinacidiphila reveromycinica TaxID=659352 RepID=A0A7U3UZ04_9ACTN|nr:hypothetical protein [Streptomyces sp. SN-593]BBB01439.1 hypothetical protein RVR_8857 [Streptomyces sp. SN-593]